MATKPGTIKAVIDVDLPHPRERTEPGIIALERKIKHLVREEGRQARRHVRARGARVPNARLPRPRCRTMRR